MGSAIGGAGGGASNVFGPPPIFRENSVKYTINIQCFSLKKKQWNACIVVYIVQCFLVQDTAVYMYTHKLTCMTC